MLTLPRQVDAAALEGFKKIASTSIVDGAAYDTDTRDPLRAADFMLNKVSTQLLANSHPLRLQSWTAAQMCAGALLFKVRLTPLLELALIYR